MSNNILPTKEELLATIKRSLIPTVLVEGGDDIIFYRRIEEEFDSMELSMLPAGNKEAVLSIKKEIDSWPENKIIAYIVDQDTWINFGVPKDIGNVILTKGYSIENDLFEDGDLCSLLYKEEVDKFNLDMERFIRWYALTLNRNKQGRKQDNGDDFCYRETPARVLDDEFFTNQTKLYDNEKYPVNLYDDIKLNWCLKLRGKSLLALILRQLSNKKRRAKYNRHSLMDLAASRKGNNYMRIVSALREQFVNNP